MGSSLSTPPPAPLVQVRAPRGKVLVPPETAFTIHPPPPTSPPPSYARSRSEPYTTTTSAIGPIYMPYIEGGGGGGGRGRRARPRNNGYNVPGYEYVGGGRRGTDTDIAWEGSSKDSDSTLDNEMIRRRRRRRGGGGGVKGYPGGIGMGMGMGMMIGQRSTFGRLDTLDPNLRSAAEMPGMATRYAGIPVGMPAAGMQHQRQHQHQHQHQHQQPSGLPPEYTSNHNLAAYGGDGIMAGAAMVNSYSSYPSIRPSPPSSNSPPLPQSVPRERPNHYEHVPMGAYADTKAAKQPLRSHADPHASMHLNRGQPSSQKIGSLGQEWLDGDAFLDACICTTSCSCRKSHRVLYRARKDDHKAGSDSDGEHHEYTSGEIRYVLKDDLGRDCGDHTECRENKIDSDKEDKSSKNKDRKEGKKLQRQFRGFKDELLEALDERLDDMRKERRQRSEAQGPAWPSLGASGLGQSLNMVNNSPGLDARMAEEMGIRNYDPYGVTVSRIDPLPHGFSGLAAPGMRGHGNDVSDMNDMGLHTDIKGNADMSPDMTMGKRNAMRPNLTSHHGAKAQNPGGRGGVVERHSSSGSSTSSARRGWAHRDYESDEFDVGVGRDGSRMRSTTRQRGRFERTGRGNNRLGSRNQDMPSRDNVGSSPHERTDHSRSRARRARADTDDDDAY